MAHALSPTMTLREFENGYWYLDQLKDFAERIRGIPPGRYLNFVTDFLEADKRATRTEAIAAWNELKELDVSQGL